MSTGQKDVIFPTLQKNTSTNLIVKLVMYYHVYSSPLQKCPLFKDDTDRRFFLNRIVLCLLGTNILIYAFCLMDNHIHFLVSGEESSILKLFTDVKREYGRWLSRSSGPIEVNLDGFEISMRLIKGEEDFKTVVAYILRNPVAAGLGSPTSYKWSSAFLYFNPWLNHLNNISVKEYGITRLRTETGRRNELPTDMSLLDGIFTPARWCNYKKVEQVFGRPIELFKMLGKYGIENEEEGKMEQVEKNSHNDSFILAKVQEFCTLNGVEKVDSLTTVEVRALTRSLRDRWGASKKQIERIIGDAIMSVR